MERNGSFSDPVPRSLNFGPERPNALLYQGRIYTNINQIDFPVWEEVEGQRYLAPGVSLIYVPQMTVEPQMPVNYQMPADALRYAPQEASIPENPDIYDAVSPRQLEDNHESAVARKTRAGRKEHSDDASDDESLASSDDEAVLVYYQDYIEADTDGRPLQWNKPDKDDTIPATIQKKRVWACHLRDAILNNKGVNEKTSPVAFQNRWGDAATHYSPQAFEKLAWRILEFAISVHVDGWFTEILDPNLWSAIKNTESWTFKKRINAIIKLLMISKRTCEDLMKGERFTTIVGAPDMLKRRCNGNKRSNDIRGNRFRRVMAKTASKEEGSGSGKGKATELEEIEEEAVEDKDTTKVDGKSDARGKKRKAEDFEEGATLDETKTPVRPRRSARAIKRRRVESFVDTTSDDGIESP